MSAMRERGEEEGRRGRGGELDGRELELPRGSTWSAVLGRAGLEVRCTRGLALVTVEGDPEDHVLSAGETFRTSHRGRLAVWALEPAGLRLTRPASSAVEIAIAPRFGSR
jgi:hypothetical protein